jgi:hypothetical protein
VPRLEQREEEAAENEFLAYRDQEQAEEGAGEAQIRVLNPRISGQGMAGQQAQEQRDGDLRERRCRHESHEDGDRA